MTLEIVVADINQSSLSPTTKANALALLQATHADNGHVAISWSDLAAMFGGVDFRVVRRHLGYMQSAELIHYSSNGDGVVYVNFKAWIRRSRVGARNTCTEDTKNVHSVHDPVAPNPPVDQPADDGSRVGARNTCIEDTKNARGRALPHTRIGWMDGSISNPTDTEIHPSIPAPEPHAQTPGRALLADPDVRVRPDAQCFADKYPFAVVRTCVAAWYMNRKAVKGKLQNDAGIVVHWLKECNGVPPNGYDADAWQRTDLYRRHRTPTEIAADAQAEADAAAREDVLANRVLPDPAPPSPYLDDDPAWQHLAQPGTNYAGQLAGLVRIDDAAGTPVYVLAARDPTRIQWLELRVAKQMQRAIQAVIGRPALVEIVPPLTE